jgi:hypothetical protein
MKFIEGDSVRVIPTAPHQLRPGIGGSICAIRTLEKDRVINQVKEAAGTTLYLVEFGDGFAIEIPDRYLVPL